MRPWPLGALALLAALRHPRGQSNPEAISAESPTVCRHPTPHHRVTQLFPIYMVERRQSRRAGHPRASRSPDHLGAARELIEEPTAEESDARLVSIVPPEITFVVETIPPKKAVWLSSISCRGPGSTRWRVRPHAGSGTAGLDPHREPFDRLGD